MADQTGVFELRKFVAPEFIFGTGARNLAGRYAANLGALKVLLVTDPGVINAGWTADVISSLKRAGLACVVFSDVTPNPRDRQVMTGAEVYRRAGCNAIVAVGGGSAIDCAKGIGIVSSNIRDILAFEGVDEVPVPCPPLICIPTTAGSSADLSQFAIINDTKRKVKIAIISKTVVPDLALLDPETTASMDNYLTACTGMDALVHAIEAYVSNAHSPITDLHALEAVRLVSGNLEQVLKRPADMELRYRLMLGSMHAGLAFSNASLGAVHAMAHSLGGLLDLAHGEANAILLSHVIDYNFDSAPERYRIIGQAMGVADGSPQSVAGAAARLKVAVGITAALSEKGLTRNDIPKLAQNALRDACMATNPRRPTQREIEEIYERAF